MYQVNIFDRLAEPAEVAEEQRGFLLSEWKLHDADVTEVLAWAEEKAAGRPYTVAVATADPDDEAYRIHLFGKSPLHDDSPSEPYVLAPDVVPDIEDFVRRARDGQ